MERPDQIEYLENTHGFEQASLAAFTDSELDDLYEIHLKQEREERETLTESITAESDEFEEDDLENAELSILRGISEEVTPAFEDWGVY